MTPAEEIYIIIPAYNESDVLRTTAEELLSLKYQVVIVDGGSKPPLQPLVAGLKVHYLLHPVNLGQGASLQTGMEYALSQGAKLLVHFDADGQHQPADIPVLAAAVESGKADVALGSRFLRSEDRKAVPFSKRLLLGMARMINGVFTGLWLTDAHNGFRVLSASAASRIQIKENRMAHATEILTLIKRNKLRYTERPTHIRYTDYSKAKGQRPMNAFNILIDLILNKIFR